jgi:hypothetical protein
MKSLAIISANLELCYNKISLLGNISTVYKTQGTIIIKEMTKGNKTVQHKDINWSKRILGKLALAHIKTKIIRQDFNPNTILGNNPFKTGFKLISFLEI